MRIGVGGPEPSCTDGDNPDNPRDPYIGSFCAFFFPAGVPVHDPQPVTSDRPNLGGMRAQASEA